MGTNYYYQYNRCDCCGRCSTVHIGKSASGWKFGFRGYTQESDFGVEIRSWKDWKRFFNENPGVIVTEYNLAPSAGQNQVIVPLETFELLIFSKQETGKHHEDYPFKKAVTDDEGYYFDFQEFS